MALEHDFVNFPELTNAQLATELWNSPHKQITEDFFAEVVKVHDGDTITLRWFERDFDFPLRFLGIDTKELNEDGESAREWLKNQIEGEEVYIKIDRDNRVGKYGRILGRVIHRGLDMNEALQHQGFARPYDQRNDGKLPNMEKELDIKQWLTL